MNKILCTLKKPTFAMSAESIVCHVVLPALQSCFQEWLQHPQEQCSIYYNSKKSSQSA